MRCTRPCRLCRYDSTCGVYIRQLRELVSSWPARAPHPMPDICVECVYYVRAEEK
jgi:hypothetical protein